MLDLFTIFSKGGIVLWCFQSTQQSFTYSVNALIKSVILQERGGADAFTHEALTLKYKLDNEFELVFVVAYQKILQLGYIDKLLSSIQIEFRNKYKDDLKQGKTSRSFDFTDCFQDILRTTEEAHKLELKEKKKMKTFDESSKSKKTVASMIVNKTDESQGKGKKKGKAETKQVIEDIPRAASHPVTNGNGELNQDIIMKNREKMFGAGKKKPKADKKSPVAEESKKKGKVGRKWDLSGGETGPLDFSNGDATANDTEPSVDEQELQQVGQMGGELRPIEPDSSSEDESDAPAPAAAPVKTKAKAKSGGFGFLSGLRGLVGSKTLTRETIEPVLLKMKDHLIAKNVAVEIADKLCESIATKLEGRVLGTFNTVAAVVKQSLQEACVQILSPKRRVDILRDVTEAKRQRRPYTITFCGVNGVGKSTNLAKVCFWLVENGYRVLIAACDTFRAGAVEQLRTHQRKLNAMHPPEAHQGMNMVYLYEKGYGKDAAGIAMEAINYARDLKYDVALIDTAGRMQDNEPLMRALSKLIKINQPDLVLFVGEALVGNEAIDQLNKFNQALADHSNMEKPHIIDGILLTKFDTIDDQVGAAISMTYITGQPIVFVGTGQTYTDLKNLNAKAVVHALLK